MQTVGQILKQTREEKGLTQKDIENNISIRVLYINAIEEDNYNILPGEVYTKGFIRNYSVFLGLDESKIIALYKEQRYNNIAATASQAVDNKVDPKNENVKSEPILKAPQKQNKIMLIITAGIIIIILIVLGYNFFSSKDSMQETPLKQNVKVETKQIVVPQTTKIDSTPIPTKVNITIKYTDECWTYIQGDQKNIYEGVGRPGETKVFEANNSLYIKLGNAGAVEIIHNGQKVGKIGQKGEVIEKTYSLTNNKQ